jgi:hypothetical protein
MNEASQVGFAISSPTPKGDQFWASVRSHPAVLCPYLDVVLSPSAISIDRLSSICSAGLGRAGRSTATNVSLAAAVLSRSTRTLRAVVRENKETQSVSSSLIAELLVSAPRRIDTEPPLTGSALVGGTAYASPWMPSGISPPRAGSGVRLTHRPAPYKVCQSASRRATGAWVAS